MIRRRSWLHGQLDAAVGWQIRAVRPAEVLEQKAQVVGEGVAEAIGLLVFAGVDREPEVADPAEVVEDLDVERLAFGGVILIDIWCLLW